MVINLEKKDIKYINNNYSKLKIFDDKIEWELEFKVEYKDFFISDSYNLRINLGSKNNSMLPTVVDLWWRVEKISKKYNKILDDIHVNADKTFCLVVDEEESKYLTNWIFNWPDFFKKILEPYLFQMSFYDDEWYFPLWERAHWFLGYLELYEEWGINFKKLINNNKYRIKIINKYINIKGHHNCLCWSWKQIRNCHKQILGAFYKLRKKYGKRITLNN